MRMNIPKELTTITPLSKYLSMLLFVLLPLVGLSFGIKYQSKLQLSCQPQLKCLDPKSTSLPSFSEVSPSIIYRPIYIEKDATVYDAQRLREKTNGWKTYQNTAFSFKYPPEWEVKNLLRSDTDLDWLKNSELYIGIRPETLVVDVLGSIRVTTDSPEEIAETGYAVIREHREKYYVFGGDLSDETLKTIYASFRFTD